MEKIVTPCGVITRGREDREKDCTGPMARAELRMAGMYSTVISHRVSWSIAQEVTSAMTTTSFAVPSARRHVQRQADHVDDRAGECGVRLGAAFEGDDVRVQGLQAGDSPLKWR